MQEYMSNQDIRPGRCIRDAWSGFLPNVLALFERSAEVRDLQIRVNHAGEVKIAATKSDIDVSPLHRYGEDSVH